MAQITLNANHCWIDTTPENLSKNYGDFGIYILGIKNSQGQIVPYYVGETSKDISNYIISKICLIKSPKTTWAMFSNNFHSGKTLNRNSIISRVPNPGQNYPPSSYGNELVYLNNGDFLNIVLGQKNWPQTDKKDNLSVLSRFSNSLNLFHEALKVQDFYFSPANLYFCPITIVSDNLGKADLTKLLKSLETFVKFSLKENTVGKSQSLQTMSKNLNGISVSLNISGIPCNVLRSEFYPTPR